MLDNHASPLGEEQLEPTPRIEQEIQELLTGDLRETALGFAGYLRENQLTPKPWFGPGYWRIPHGENYLCGIVLNQDRWRFWFFSGDYSGAFNEGYKKTVQACVNPCVSCTGTECPTGKNVVVFGQEFENSCFQFPIQFENPDEEALACIKELLDYWKDAAPRSDSWHCR